MGTAYPRVEHLREDAPAVNAFSITPTDGVDLVYTTRALYIGVSGDVAVETLDGTTITFTNVPVGIFPVRVNKVLATGTDAQEIIGLV